MPLDPTDLVRETRDLAADAHDAVFYESGRNAQRLTRYGGFWRRINSASRFSHLLGRLGNAGEAGWLGMLFALPALLWGFITRRGTRKPAKDS